MAEKILNFSFHQLCTKIWNNTSWPEDWVNSMFVPIPKKGDTQQCSNNRTIALISHSSKILLKIIARRMKMKLSEEIAEELCGFRPGRGTRNQILNLKMIIEKNRERGNDLFLCFIDYAKAFDTVVHEALWNDMQEMGFPTHIILLLKTMYDQQKAAVRTTYGPTDWFEIGQGVRQGCVLSPHLFNIYSESIMRKALHDSEGEVMVAGHKVTNLRYADDVVLIAASMTELQELVDRVKTESERSGLFLNVKKTKVTKIRKNPDIDDNDSHITVDNDAVENVTDFTYLGATFTDNYDESKEIRRRIGIAKSATTALSNIWKDRSITLATKKRLLNSLVFPIATYGSVCWVMKASNRKRLESFELWCYRRILRISWAEKKTNEFVLGKSGLQFQGDRLANTVYGRQLGFIGHVLRHESLEKTLLISMVLGKRGRGRPTTRLCT